MLELKHRIYLALVVSFIIGALTMAFTVENDMGYLGIGDPAPDIVLKNHKGSKKKLSQYQGKVVLVQFWASWCLPCRQFSDDWVNVYKKYKKSKFQDAKGFEIYSISLDKKKKAWKKATKKDGLPWKANTIDKKGWDSDYAFIYGVNSLPADFLLDADGNIIAKNLTPYQLDRLLSEMEKK